VLEKKERQKITAILFIPTGTFCRGKTSQFPLSPLDCSRNNCRLTVGYRHLANRIKTMRHTAIVANPGYRSDKEEVNGRVIILE